ncbi:hypothetical protein K7X08_007511 [Anisodus acutangulus]|uniref:Uncharacterized protein n=1 Tax=Anisodus acutangulus TaxID=402998 RepID=A0A9Q1LFT5_9SOLA|nr:hypothetical protein K7X08_007511 [Anisodus acutangulus]
MLALEEEIKMIVGRAAKSKKEIDSKIQTFLQQSTKARESVAEQLPAVEKRQSDVTRDYDSLMTELEPLHAELQRQKDTNLEEQKARIEESEQAALKAWEDTKKAVAEIFWKMEIILIRPVCTTFDDVV